MGECRLNHSVEDVQNKLTEQKDFLPLDIFRSISSFLEQKSLEQNTLNELFHLLKKYDLSDATEQARRNEALKLYKDN